MTNLKVKQIYLDEDNDVLVCNYLPKHFLEIKSIKNIEHPQLKLLQSQLDKAKHDKEKEYFTQCIAELPIVKEVYFTVYSNISYEELVAKLVREKYTADEENAIQRKAILNGITEEFSAYNQYAEECKVRAKEYIARRESVLNEQKNN
jgi:hypothetical protein